MSPSSTPTRTRIKLCGLTREQDVDAAVAAGAVRALGVSNFSEAHLAQLLGTGLGFISMSSLTAGWVLSGASSQWKGARPGKVFETLVDGAPPPLPVRTAWRARSGSSCLVKAWTRSSDSAPSTIQS